MGNKLKNYIKYASEFDSSSLSEEERKAYASRMLTEIGFFQHERLVHLIVTVTFAILAILVFGVYMITNVWNVLVLLAFIFVLLIPYIKHYFLLENGVQRLYDIYDEKFPIDK